MNRTLPWILLVLTTIVHAAQAAPAAPPTLLPTSTHAETAGVSAKVLSRFHYQAAPLDDAMSGQIFDRYLKALDPERVFFVQADIDRFAANRTALDDAILRQDLEVPYAIFRTYSERVRQRLSGARELLARGFDFDRTETYRYLRTDVPWPASEDAVREVWRKRVKNDWLRLKLAGKDDKAIRETLDKRYDNALTRVARYKSDDVFQMFMNAYATAIEPHTNYLGPRASEDFAIAMRLSLVGIGAVLQERDDYVTIRELVPGGPASRSGQLAIGDRIVGVAQGEQSVAADVLGWRVDDVVGLIRGAKGTTVVLDVLPADAGQDGEHKRITLVRDTINLENQAASKSVIEVAGATAPHRIGVIKLPTFYQDTGARRGSDGDFRSATRDVARLLAELKADKVDAVLVDLRNNGGGSLDEAIRLTGLFIDTGPVVQQRDAQGQIRVDRDVDPGLAWDGPLGVMINRASASASEIFAAAIQDYGRGVIIGEQSFGKGTVQTLVSLDQMVRSEKPKYGELKMTVAQFFRITGGTTQLRGVTPDIGLPAMGDAERFGESSYDNALPWTQIAPAQYKPAGNAPDLLPLLKTRHASRTARDTEYAYLQEDVAELKALRERSEISLNESERRKERARQEARLKARETARSGATVAVADAAAGRPAGTDVIAALRDDGLLAGERSLRAELDAEESSKDAKDVLLGEATRILADMVDILGADAPRAASLLPGTAMRMN